jgi:hypothetical protein
VTSCEIVRGAPGTVAYGAWGNADRGRDTYYYAPRTEPVRAALPHMAPTSGIWDN